MSQLLFEFEAIASAKNSRIICNKLDGTILGVLFVCDYFESIFFREWTLKCDIFNAFLGLTFNGFNLK